MANTQTFEIFLNNDLTELYSLDS